MRRRAMTRLGAVLAGGRSRRFGSNKAHARWEGRSLADHAAALIAPFVGTTIVCGGRAVIADFLHLPDQPAPGLGPLGGLCAALDHAAAHGHAAVLSIGCDMPLLDSALIERLIAPGASRYLVQAPIVGCWHAELAQPLRRHLESGGDRSVHRWAAQVGADPVDAGRDLPNINTPAELAAIEGLRPPRL